MEIPENMLNNMFPWGEWVSKKKQALKRNLGPNPTRDVKKDIYINELEDVSKVLKLVKSKNMDIERANTARSEGEKIIKIPEHHLTDYKKKLELESNRGGGKRRKSKRKSSKKSKRRKRGKRKSSKRSSRRRRH